MNDAERITVPMIDGPGKGKTARIAPWGAVAYAREATFTAPDAVVLYRPRRYHLLGYVITVLSCAEGEPDERDVFTAVVNPGVAGSAERVNWACEHTLRGEAPCPFGCHDKKGEGS